MATHFSTYIQHPSEAEVLEVFQQFYPIRSTIELDTPQDWLYHDVGGRCLISTQHYNNKWVELIFDTYQQDHYFYDEIIQEITHKLSTIALLTYYQSTTIEGRVARFERGRLVAEVSQGSFDNFETIVLTRQLNVSLIREGIQSIPEEVGLPFHELDYDTIYRFMAAQGLSWDGVDRPEVYRHHHYILD